jgi:hypothetical protein
MPVFKHTIWRITEVRISTQGFAGTGVEVMHCGGHEFGVAAQPQLGSRIIRVNAA